MQLTTEQQTTLRNYIQADGVLGQLPQGNGSALQIANTLNELASPSFQVYRNAVPLSEIMLNGFDWTRVDNLSVGKARIWEWMFSADPESRTIDPSKPNIRAGINAVWVGTQADLNVRDAVYAHCYRAATLAEKLLATGAGTVPANDGDGSGPAVAGATGSLSYQDINGVMGWAV